MSALDPKDAPAILVYGHSHTNAVREAVLKRQRKGRPVPITLFRFAKEKNGRTIGDISFENFLERISSLRPDDVVVSMIGGNQHALISTMQHPRPFDFFTPDAGAEQTEKVEIIPYRAILGASGNTILKGSGRQLEQMQKATKARLVHVLPPPPKFDNAHIARRTKIFAERGMAGSAISPPALRLKFWQLQARVLQKWCGKRGIEVIMPPAKAISDGFLRPEYWANDITHANARYGELVLRLVERKFAVGRRAGA